MPSSAWPPSIRQKLNTYAITISTFQQHPHFQRTAHAELFISTLFRYRDQHRFQLHAFAVMPDHVHILTTPSINQTTARCVQLIKGGYSFAARELKFGEGWHSGHHAHRIRDAEDFHNQSLYIAANPTRKSHADYPHVHTHLLCHHRLDTHPSTQLTHSK
jgi:REP element-mobilizing transposase RayT